MNTKGKAFRKRKWWQSGDDKLVEYDKRVEVWIISEHNISKLLVDDLLLESRSAI